MIGATYVVVLADTALARFDDTRRRYTLSWFADRAGEVCRIDLFGELPDQIEAGQKKSLLKTEP
jgi:hypothetical protein